MPLAVALVDDFDGLVDLHGVQGVRVVVDVGDLLARELNDHVAGLKPRLGRRAAFHHATQQQAFHLARVVGDRAGVGAHRVAAAALLEGPLYLRELEGVGLVRGAAGEQGGETGHPLQVVVVDPVRRVGRPVIVLVGTAEQVDGRNPGAVEARGVGRQVRIGLHAKIEADRDVGRFDQPRPVGTRADRLNGQAVVADAAHHVQVHVSRDLVGRDDGVAYEVRRAQQPEFLARPEG